MCFFCAFVATQSKITSLDLVDFSKKLTEQEKKCDDQFDQSGELHETNEFVTNEPKAKRGKTDDDMDLD